MKRVTLMTILCMMAVVSNGQTFSEWFRQKKTQKKYLIQQIAALKAYSEVVQKGYRIAREGLTTVRKITDGEFQLHDLFFTSLRQISPTVKHYGRVAEIIDMQIATARSTARHLRTLRRSPRASLLQLGYIEQVYGRLLDDCVRTVDELIIVTTAGELEMRDDERLFRIDQLYLRAVEQRSFSDIFGQEALMLDAVMLRELSGIEVISELYGPINE